MTDAAGDDLCLANTVALEGVDGRLVWLVECSCGWTGPHQTDEFEADLDRLGHIGGYDLRT